MAAPGSLYHEGRHVQYYRLSLPAPIGGGAHEGDWRARLEIGRRVPRVLTHGFERTGASFGTALTHGLPYSLLVHAYSNVRMAATLHQSSFAPGATIAVRAVLTEYGLPVAGRARVTARVVDPTGLVTVVALTETGPGVFTAAVHGSIPGTWEVRFHADGRTLRGQPFTREAVRTAAIWHGGDIEPPSSYEGSDPSATLCRLLSCLLHEHVMRDDLRRRLHEEGFDVDALAKCVEFACSARQRPR